MRNCKGMKNCKGYTENEVVKKRKLARNLFAGLHPPRHRTEEQHELLKEILEQIQICEELCCPVSEKQIEEWVHCKTIDQLMVKVKTQKGFTSQKVIVPYRGRRRVEVRASLI